MQINRMSFISSNSRLGINILSAVMRILVRNVRKNGSNFKTLTSSNGIQRIKIWTCWTFAVDGVAWIFCTCPISTTYSCMMGISFNWRTQFIEFQAKEKSLHGRVARICKNSSFQISWMRNIRKPNSPWWCAALHWQYWVWSNSKSSSKISRLEWR